METLIVLHSYNRYMVVLLLLATILHFSFKYWKNAAPAPLDRALAGANLGFAHLQLLLGLATYFMGGHHQNINMKDQASRYWGMEHLLMMLIAIVLITLSVAATKRIEDNKKRYFRIFLYNAIAFLVIAVGLSYGVAPGLFGSRM
jgi:hypothetical protein